MSGHRREGLRKHSCTGSHLEKDCRTILAKGKYEGDKEGSGIKTLPVPAGQFKSCVSSGLSAGHPAMLYCSKGQIPFGSAYLSTSSLVHFLTRCSLSGLMFPPLSWMCGPLWVWLKNWQHWDHQSDRKALWLVSAGLHLKPNVTILNIVLCLPLRLNMRVSTSAG